MYIVQCTLYTVQYIMGKIKKSRNNAPIKTAARFSVLS